MIKDKRGVFLSLVHNTSTIRNGTKLGEGLILFPFVNIATNVSLGSWVSILPFSVLGHHITIGNFCHLNAYSFLSGYTRLGSLVTVNTGATIIPGMSIGDKVSSPGKSFFLCQPFIYIGSALEYRKPDKKVGYAYSVGKELKKDYFSYRLFYLS